VPGRPALYSTTKAFLDDLSLRSLDELPPLEDLGSLIEAALQPTPQAEPSPHDALTGPGNERALEEGEPADAALAQGLASS
jgi:segregation and condensation protein B